MANANSPFGICTINLIMIKNLKRIMQWGCLILFIISSSVCFTFLATLVTYPIDINYFHLLDIIPIEFKTLLNNYYQLLAYLCLPWINKLVIPNFPSSTNGLAHFAAVKQLLLFNNISMLITGYVAVKFLITLRKNKQAWQLRYLVTGLLIVIIGIGIGMLSNFDKFFVIFHQLLFHNYDWLFDPNTDPIINALPITFFEQCFVIFGILLLIWLISLLFISSKNKSR